MSLSEMTYIIVSVYALMTDYVSKLATYIFMTQMLQKLQLPISSLRQDWCAERLHDFFYGDRLICQFVFCRAISPISKQCDGMANFGHVPDKSEGSHSNRLEIDIARCDFEGSTKDLSPYDWQSQRCARHKRTR